MHPVQRRLVCLCRPCVRKNGRKREEYKVRVDVMEIIAILYHTFDLQADWSHDDLPWQVVEMINQAKQDLPSFTTTTKICTQAIAGFD
jgi:hypothetical protein